MSYPLLSHRSRSFSHKTEIKHSPKSLRIALLLHAHYAQSALLPSLFHLLNKQGNLIIKRLYAHHQQFNQAWSSDKLHEYGLQAMPQLDPQAISIGSNLLIDAMDLILSKKIDAIALCVHDPMQSALITKARAEGIQVFGYGWETSLDYESWCDQFFLLDRHIHYTDRSFFDRPHANAFNPNKDSRATFESSFLSESQSALPTTDEEPEEEDNFDDSTPMPQKRMIRSLPLRTMVYKAIRDCAEPDGWTLTTKLGGYLRYLQPTFDYKMLGYPKLSDFLRAIPALQFHYESPTRLFCRKIDYASLLDVLEQAFHDYQGTDGWADLDDVEQYVSERWSFREYGFEDFVSLLNTVVGAEVDEVNHLMRYTKTTRYPS
ncbi:MAG: NYN domain-containing protein [Cardiobacteriaceae bacterium]|nr:NYN domain-containing protein [Cardiobacteriaceae bacterium]